MLISLTLITIYVLTATAMAVTLWSAIHGLRCRRGEAVQNNIRVRLIASTIAVLLAALLFITAVTASTQPIAINGKPYADGFWLRTTGMLINSSLTLIIIAIAAVGISSFHPGRRLK